MKLGIPVNESTAESFLTEFQLTNAIRHRHIVEVTDHGRDGDYFFLVMEHLHGGSLEQLFERQQRRLTREQLRQFVDEIGDAIAATHSKHVIHRDLKPRNIFLKSKIGEGKSPDQIDADERFILVDFRIAAKLDTDRPLRNQAQDGAGTIEYMAPELLSKQPASSPQTDIYAFGVILYQMLTGQVPFPLSDGTHIGIAKSIQAILHAPPHPFLMKSKDPHVSKAMEELVLQCLEKDPLRRPQSMSEVRHRFLDLP